MNSSARAASKSSSRVTSRQARQNATYGSRLFQQALLDSLKKLDPGLYRLQVKVDDNVSKQSISPSARFMIE